MEASLPAKQPTDFVARRLRSGWIVLTAALGSAAVVLWWMPATKPRAVLGRLDYGQFVVATLTTVLFASVLMIAVAPSEKRRGRGFRIAAVLLGTGLMLACCEAFAWFWPVRHPLDNPWYIDGGQGALASKELLITRPPHLFWQGSSRGDLALERDDVDPFARTITFQSDAEGFRNGRDIDTAEIIFLGDSFTEAGNVLEEETFVQQTGQKLGTTVRNLGRAAYSPLVESIVLKNYGLKCQPRTVVWQISEMNDLWEEVLYKRWYDSGRPRSRLGEQTPKQLKELRLKTWQDRSPTYRLFALLRRSEPYPLEGMFRDADGTLVPIRINNKPGIEHRPLVHPGWPLLAESLRNGAALLQRDGIELIVLLIPMKTRVVGEHVDWSDAARSWLGSDWDLAPEETMAFQLSALSDELGVPFIDATPRLKERTAAGEVVYLPFDTHLSPTGHKFVADLIADKVQQTRAAHPPQ